MLNDLGKGGKAVFSVFVFFVLYGVLTFFFSVNTIMNDCTASTFLGCVPYMAALKLILSALIILMIWLKGNGLDIKAERVGNGQHGTARFATQKEKQETYTLVAEGKETVPGFIVEMNHPYWRVDMSDNSMLLLAPPGGGKTKRLMIPTIYYNAMVNKNTHGRGASMLITDCKGEEITTCGGFLKDAGYRVLYLDFRFPLRSYHNNLMFNTNKEIDKYKAAKDESEKILHYARAERYAKTLSGSIVENMGAVVKNETSQFFNETSKGLITALTLLVSEYGEEGERHIISVFKLLIELNGLSEGSTETEQKNRLEELLSYVNNDRILNFAGPSMKADVRTSMNIFSSALGKLVAFIDAELEQMVCDQSPELNDIDFIKEPTAIFLVCPDENTTRHFFASLFIRYLMNDLIAQAEETNHVLTRPVLCIWDEFGNMPAIQDMDVLMSAARSRGIRFILSVQSLAQLEKNYQDKLAVIMRDSIQMTMFTYVSPNSRHTAEELSKTLGSQTVLSGSVSSGKTSTSTNLQMIGRPLMTPDEIINMKPGNFIIMKAGARPAKTKLPLYFKYLRNIQPYTPAAPQCEIRKIKYLTSDKIKSFVSRQQAKLTRGMFD